jgi:hypothetical protein
MQRTGTERSRKQKLINAISIHTQTYIEFHRQPGLDISIHTQTYIEFHRQPGLDISIHTQTYIEFHRQPGLDISIHTQTYIEFHRQPGLDISIHTQTYIEFHRQPGLDISIHTQTYIEFHRQPGLGLGSVGKAFVTDSTQSPNLAGLNCQLGLPLLELQSLLQASNCLAVFADQATKQAAHSHITCHRKAEKKSHKEQIKSGVLFASRCKVAKYRDR